MYTTTGLSMNQNNNEIYLINASYLNLTSESTSISSLELVELLSNECNQHLGGVKTPSKRLKKAVSALIADLLECAGRDRAGFRYRCMGSTSFTGEAVGYEAFKRAYDPLVSLGYIENIPGKKGSAGGAGTATRMRATRKLIELAATYGIQLDQLAKHFKDGPPPTSVREPVIMRAPSRKKGGDRYQGEIRKLDKTHPGIMSDIARINRLNAFMAKVPITGCKRWTFQRIYCDAGDEARYGRYGGRIYSPFQNMDREERHAIRINGEATAEIDIGASFLTIYYSMIGKPLDTNGPDLYAMPWPCRDVAKAYINATFGNGKFLGRWSEAIVDRLENPKDKDKIPIPNVGKNFPLGRVRTAVADKYPDLADMEKHGISWGDLHYKESQTILRTMERLALELSIPSLPIHDALIVAQSRANIASHILRDEFKKAMGVKPIIKIKTVGVEPAIAA
jgi:hypothetical protein